LRAFLSYCGGSEVLLDNTASISTEGTVKLTAPKALITVLRGDDKPSVDDTVKLVHKGKYFPDEAHMPSILSAVVAGLQDGSSALVMSAFGGALYYLKRSLIDFEILSMGKIVPYIPPDEEQQVIATQVDNESTQLFSTTTLIAAHDASSAVAIEHQKQTQNTALPSEARSMTLDAIALNNLEILVNNFDRSEKGSLWAFMNRCKTSFGRRLLKEWITRPLLQPADIAKRNKAVEEFLTGELAGRVDRVRTLLKSVPDLERLLARVHSNGLRSKGVNHPDSRAVMYEATTYNTRKIKDFADTLAGFDVLVKIGLDLENVAMSSSLLQKITKPVVASSATGGGKFPLKEMSNLLKFYRDIFDEKQAKREGCIKPKVALLCNYLKAATPHFLMQLLVLLYF
jgi:DNA mismatch repair protein MSH6